MAVSIGQFVEQLAASGLMTAAEIESFQAGLPPEKSPHDAQALARELILAGKLTKYQAQCVYQRKTKGLVLGEYVVLDKIGEGGMGQVLKARHRTMERIVALKILPSKSVDSPDAIKRFRREVQAAARLTHPNIVMAYDAGEHTGIHFLAMEYVEGKDLASVIKERGPLELAPALDYTLQAARGLAYAHAEGVIHRDIKPGNLLLDKKGTVKILDMGLARVALPAGTSEPGPERLTNSGQVMGTCDYMAPEQAYDTHTADQRSDIYSLGCTLHRLLTGNPPYSRDTLMQILIAHREARIPSLRDARPDVHERVDEVFQKMVAKEPEDRQQSMAEVIADLVGCLRLVAMPAAAAPAREESLSGAASDSLLQNLSFLQESVPPPLPKRSVRAGSRDDTQRTAADDQTGTSIAARIKRVMAASGQNPLALLAVAGASALLVVVVALVLNFTGRGPTADLSLPPGERGGEGKPSKDLASAGHSPSAQPKRKGAAPPLAIAPFDADAARKHQEAWAEYLGVPVELTNSIGMKFVLIPPGEFDMGTTQEEVGELVKEAKEKNYDPWYIERLPGEAPRHRVRLTNPFYLGACEVTVGAFRRFVDDTGYKTDAEKDGKGGHGLDETGVRTQKPEFVWRNVGFAQTDAHPVVLVSWNDAAAFCQWLSRKESKEYRLATEAEWEYTCRAGSTTRYSFGDEEAALGDYAWCGGNSGDKTHPVGERKPNAWGLYDMHGNVWEWCADGYDAKYYERSPKDDPPGPTSGASRIIRGGSWYYWPGGDRSASRDWYAPDYRICNSGFRVARTVLPSAAKSDEAGEFPGLPEFPETPAATTPAPVAASPDGWSEPVNLGSTVNSSAEDYDPTLSADELLLVFQSDRTGGQGGIDLWMSSRPSRDERFGQPENLGATVNSGEHEIQPGLSADGLTLLFTSDRPGGCGGRDLWSCSRASRGDRFSKPINLGPAVNSGDDDELPFLSADGLTLLFHSRRPGGQGGLDVWACTRASPEKPFSRAVNLGPTVNSSANDGAPSITADGLKLYFASDRPGGLGDYDMWMCARASLDSPFDQPVNLGPTVNTAALDGAPRLSTNGLVLYFCSNRPGGQGGCDLWMCTRPPPTAKPDPSASRRDTPSSPDGWSEPVNLGPTVNTSGHESGPTVSADGLILIFQSARSRGEGLLDLWMCVRGSRDEPFGQVVNLGPTVNSGAKDIQPSLSGDGLTLLFASDRSDGQGHDDLWMCQRASRTEPFGQPANLGPVVNSSDRDWTPSLSADELMLYFSSNRRGGQGGQDLWMCRRASPSGTFGQPVNLGATVNSNAEEHGPAVSPDGLKLWFGSDRPGGQGSTDLWMATRPSLNEPFGQAVNLGAVVNSSAFDECPALTADGLTLVFQSTRPGGHGEYDLWMCTRASRGDPASSSGTPQPWSLPKDNGPAPPLAIAPFDAAAARNHQKAWADYLGVPVEITNSIGMKIVLIPPGEFDMGSTQVEVDELLKKAKEKNLDQWHIDRLPAEAPRHRVRLTKPFYLGACEVTVGAFRRFVDDTGYKSDAEKDGKGGYGRDEKGGWTQKPEIVWRNPGFTQTDAHPVVNVTWNDAAAFCQWLSRKESKEYRLATEAEWEYTCRAGSTTRYSFGDEEALGDYVWWPGNSGTKTHPAGEKKPNAWGLYDMHGNVWEWCADGYDAKYYERSPKDDPPGPTSEASRVLRGGSWNYWPYSTRSASRGGSTPDNRNFDAGFRVARTVLPSAAKYEVLRP